MRNLQMPVSSRTRGQKRRRESTKRASLNLDYSRKRFCVECDRVGKKASLNLDFSRKPF